MAQKFDRNREPYELFSNISDINLSDIGADFEEEKEKKPDDISGGQFSQEEEDQWYANKMVQSHRGGFRNIVRKATSERALCESLSWHFQEGDCYHCFSWGDVDELSFLKHVLRQQKVKYAAICSMAIAGTDIEDIASWWERGYIGRVDFFLSKLYIGSYPDSYIMLNDFLRKEKGRFVIFRNHAKVIAVQGEKFDCLIESSANANTNPRCENTVVTVDRELTRDYIKLFAGIQPLNENFGAPPYDIEETT